MVIEYMQEVPNRLLHPEFALHVVEGQAFLHVEKIYLSCGRVQLSRSTTTRPRC
jgi:hypothetical protein